MNDAFLYGDAAARKQAPMAEGLLWYFPDALACVASVSKQGNAQHHPGQPLHHARGKSTDHADCILRHLAHAGTLDKDGVRETAKVAWRALALLQEELEAAHSLPLPRNAWTGPEPSYENREEPLSDDATKWPVEKDLAHAAVAGTQRWLRNRDPLDVQMEAAANAIRDEQPRAGDYFKKGDRVRVLSIDDADRKYTTLRVGDTGTVLEDHSHVPYVEFDRDVGGSVDDFGEPGRTYPVIDAQLAYARPAHPMVAEAIRMRD